MESENPSGADDQQETASSCNVLDPNWIVGFVDGEGCFSVSVHRSSMMHRHGGWQLQPVFHIYQHGDHRDVLEAMISSLRLRPSATRGSEQQCLDQRGRRTSEPRHARGAVLRTVSTIGQASRLRFLGHRSFDAKEGTLVTQWVRAPGPSGLWHERQRQAAVQNDRASPCRLLRDCTRGSPADGGRRVTKIQSDPHGDMRS